MEIALISNFDSNQVVGFAQSVKSSPWHISIRLRFNGKTRYLLIPRGLNKFNKVLISKNEIESRFRCSDKLRDKVKNFCLNGFVKNVSLTEGNILITFLKGNHERFLSITYGAGMYFVGYFATDKIFLPYKEKMFVKKGNEPLIHHVNHEMELLRKRYKCKHLISWHLIDSYSDEVDKSKVFEKALNKKKKKNNKKKLKIERDIERLSCAKRAKNELASNNIAISENDEIFSFDKIEIKIKNIHGKYQKIDYVFNKLKAYEKAVAIQIQRLKFLVEENKEQILLSDYISYPATGIVKEVIKNNANILGRDYRDLNGNILRFGRNVEENINIKNYWAKKTDYWFHLDNQSSSHAFLRLKVESITQDLLEFVANCFCDIENVTEISMIYTQVKNLKTVKGKKGQVIPKNPKYFKFIKQ